MAAASMAGLSGTGEEEGKGRREYPLGTGVSILIFKAAARDSVRAEIATWEKVARDTRFR